MTYPSGFGRAKTVGERIYCQLTDAILQGEFKVGQRLRQQDVAQQYGVSTIPVREALQRLEASGLVRIVPHRGAVVVDLSEEDIADVFLVRAILEPATARLGVPNLTSRDTETMRELVEQMQTSDGSAHQWLDCNREFRLTIYRASGSPRLAELILDLYNTTRPYRSLALALPGHRQRVVELNRMLMQACEQCDVEKAELLIRESLETLGSALRELARNQASEQHEASRWSGQRNLQ